jgi:hypothetical protein
MEYDKTTFTVMTNDEAYLSQNNAGTTQDPNSRYADENRTFTYKYDIAKTVDGLKFLTWTAPISAQYLVKASADGENWIELGKSETDASKETRTFDASALAAAVEKTKTLYIQIGDAAPANGSGGRVWADAPVTLNISYIPLTDAQKDALEMMGDEHSVSIHGCNSTWSSPDYKLDYENATAGSACLSFDVKKSIVCSTGLPDINAEGMDTLEFELYLSDLAILDEIKFGGGDQIEITSGGTADQGEKNYDLNKIIDKLKASGTAVVGWNHISIPLTDMNDSDTTGVTPFDITKINFLRIFWVAASMPADSEKYTMKIDNIRLTDAQAEAARQNQKDKEAFDANYADLVAALKALGNYNTSSSVTKDNYEAVKAEIAAVKAQLAALSEKDQKIAEEVGYLNYMEKAENSVGKYEKELEKKAQAMEENKALVDAINALVTEITDANYETVKAAVEAARADYDKLSRTHKNYFTEDGLTAKLEAAEAAVKAYTPGGNQGGNQGGNNQGGNNQGGDNQGGEKKGCGSALTIGAVATMVLAGAWVTIAARKRED